MRPRAEVPARHGKFVPAIGFTMRESRPRRGWRGRPDRLCSVSRQLCRPCRPTRLWMAAVAFLDSWWNGHYGLGVEPAIARSAREIRRRRLGSMSDVFDIYTIIFLALAVFIFL